MLLLSPTGQTDAPSDPLLLVEPMLLCHAGQNAQANRQSKHHKASVFMKLNLQRDCLQLHISGGDRDKHYAVY